MKHYLLKTWLILVSLLVGTGTMWASDETITVNGTSVTGTDVTITCEKASGSSAPAVQSSGYVRLYAKNTVTISSSTKNIVALKIGWSKNTSKPYASASASVGDYTDPDSNGSTVVYGEWSGSSKSIVFTIGDTGQKQIHSVEVSYETAGGSTPEPTKYTVTVASNITGGTISADPTAAAANATVTLTATPNEGYEFGAWDVKDASNNTITVTDNKFTMPAANVNVSATFNAKATRPENEIFYESFDTNNGTGGNDDKWSGSIATNNIEQDNDGWAYEKGNGANKCAKFGAGSALGTATTPALGVACDATLTFKAAAWDANNEKTTLKLSVIGGGTITPATVTMTKGAWTTFTATLTSLTADSKIKFEGNSSSNSRFFLDEVSVVKTGNATPVKAVTSIAVKTAPTKVAYTEGDKFAPAGLVITATYNIGEPEDVAYAGNESKFSFEPSLTTALTAENTSVTITYEDKTATLAISVEAYSIANTQETAYTVAEAIALIDAGKGLATPVYVKGTVSEVVTAFNASYGNISVNISADGETTGAQFQLYRNFKGADMQKWTSATEAPEVGDQVVAYGTLTKFNTTYEMTEGNYVVSITKKTPVEPTVYTVTVNEYIQNGSVSVSATSAKEGDVVTLTATPDAGYELEEYIVMRSDNNADITVTDNKFTMPACNVSVTATFKAITGGGEEPNPEAGEGVYVLTDLKDIKANDVVIITMKYQQGKTYAISNANGTTSAPAAVEVTVSDNKITVDNSEILWNIDYNNGSFVAYVNGDSSKWLYCTNVNNGVRVGTGDAKTFSIDKGYMYEEGTTDARYIGVYSNQDFRCYTTNSGNIANQTLAFYVKKTDQNGTLNFVAANEDGYWATFSNKKNVIFDVNDVIVYTVAVDNNKLVTIEADNNSLSCVTDKTKDEGWVAGYYVQAGAAVLINAVDESVNYYYIDTDKYTPNQLTDIEAYGEYNMLKPTTSNGIYKAEADGNYYYKLAYGDNENKKQLGFWWGATDGSGNFNVKAGGAVLCVPQSDAAASNLRGFSFDGEGLATAIESVSNAAANGAIYNLQGQRMQRLQQGVNIVNGKKFVR